MSKSRFERNAANCRRFAQEAGDAVLSYGFMKMAEAWLGLENRRSHVRGVQHTRPRTSAKRRIVPRERAARRPVAAHKKPRLRVERSSSRSR
jgi:hypothetical protein